MDMLTAFWCYVYSLFLLPQYIINVIIIIIILYFGGTVVSSVTTVIGWRPIQVVPWVYPTSPNQPHAPCAFYNISINCR